MDKFIDWIKKDLRKLLQSKSVKENKDIIELPLRFYLRKINESKDIEECNGNYIIEEDIAHLTTKTFFEHRTPEIKKEIVELMKSKD